MKASLAALALMATTSAASAQFDFRGDHNSPKIYAPDGKFLGNLNNNEFDQNSVANPFGRYGSEFSPDSINNEFGRYGNPLSHTYVNPYTRRR